MAEATTHKLKYQGQSHSVTKQWSICCYRVAGIMVMTIYNSSSTSAQLADYALIVSIPITAGQQQQQQQQQQRALVIFIQTYRVVQKAVPRF